MPRHFHILVVDDEKNICSSCKRILTQENFSVTTMQNSMEVLPFLEKEHVDLILTDLKMPGMDGIELTKNVKKKFNIPIILMTAFSTVQNAVNAMKFGASDFLEKPFENEELIVRINSALQIFKLKKENEILKKKLEKKYQFQNIIGESEKMLEIYNIIEKIAATDTTVLIHGESGTGKELIAQAIHYNSSRKKNPFIYLDCGSLVETLLESELFGHTKGSFTGAEKTKPGLFEIAHTGTLFLDEIGNVSLPIQSKLLRVLQEKEIRAVGSTEHIKIDIRLITATNCNLEQMVKDGSFRKDLFYRLNIVPIQVPPLRHRTGDVRLLAEYFLKKQAEKIKQKIKSIDAETLLLLEDYDWPGNVRELENVIERMIVLTDNDIINKESLPTNIKYNTSIVQQKIEVPKTNEEFVAAKKRIRAEAVRRLEKLFVIEALKRNNGNITHAAKDVGMQRENFHSLMKNAKIKIDYNFSE